MSETILIVDDEESVRRTFRDWLVEAKLGVNILVARDAEAALVHAKNSVIDLAVLDWNLGTGNDGLQLLQDLSVFHSDIVAILVTGYAHQATPLAALRMGVRDYLDKNSDLTRESFVASVKNQLVKIAPAKKLRAWHQGLAEFRSAVEQVLPLVQSSAAMSDAVPLPEAAAELCNFFREITGAADAVFLLRVNRDSCSAYRAYRLDGSPIDEQLVEFNRTIAASALSMGEPSVIASLNGDALANAALQPFESARKSVLVVPMSVGGGVSAVVELFDHPSGFTIEHRRLAGLASTIGVSLLKQILGERQTQKTLLDAVQAALAMADGITPTTAPTTDLPIEVRDSLKRGFGDTTLELAEAVHQLATRHGESAVRHCMRLVQEVSRLLDDCTSEIPPPRIAR